MLQVAERALFLWNNDYIVSLVAQNRAAILPLIFSPLERNARNHWNQVGGVTGAGVTRVLAIRLPRSLPPLRKGFVEFLNPGF